MKNKTQRLLEIKELINSMKITSQEQLLSLLKEKDYKLTQATLSRDLKFLKVSRVMKGDEYIYAVPEKQQLEEERQVKTAEGFNSIEFSNQLAVIKTMPGFASSIAYTIDGYDAYEILGTIAGDDTILIIPREGVTHQDIKKVLVMIMPELDEKLNKNN